MKSNIKSRFRQAVEVDGKKFTLAAPLPVLQVAITAINEYGGIVNDTEGGPHTFSIEQAIRRTLLSRLKRAAVSHYIEPLQKENYTPGTMQPLHLVIEGQGMGDWRLTLPPVGEESLTEMEVA